MSLQEMQSHHKSRIPLPTVSTEEKQILTHDGLTLAGTHYLPSSTPKAAILVNSGTGMKRQLYTAFASALAEEGFAVLTYDYRGIGDSRPESLGKCEASVLDWAQKDMTAAFDLLLHLWPEQPHYVFGHSAGSLLIGFMENADQIDGIVTWGTSYGYWGHLRGTEKLIYRTMFTVGIPLLNTLFHYIPNSMMGRGEDIPAGVASDYARWGKRPDFFESELGQHPGFGRVTCPWKAFLAEDDDIATPENAYPVYRQYHRADVDIEMLSPGQLGLKELGHHRIFSRSNREAWSLISDWFKTLPLRQKNNEYPSIPTVSLEHSSSLH